MICVKFTWYFSPCIPSHPTHNHLLPSHPFPSTLVPSYPILSHFIPSHPITLYSTPFFLQFIPHCPISPYFFLPMYSSVLLLVISTFTSPLPSHFSSAVESFPNSQSFTFLFNHFSSSSSFYPSHNFLFSLLPLIIWFLSLYTDFSSFL